MLVAYGGLHNRLVGGIEPVDRFLMLGVGPPYHGQLSLDLIVGDHPIHGMRSQNGIVLYAIHQYDPGPGVSIHGVLVVRLLDPLIPAHSLRLYGRPACIKRPELWQRINLLKTYIGFDQPFSGTLQLNNPARTAMRDPQSRLSLNSDV